MSDSDTTQTRTDGGVSETDIFGTGQEDTSPRTRSPQARIRQLLDMYLYTPLGIAWSDWRTRIGGIGVLLYVLMGTVGVIVVPEPQLNEGPRYLGAFQDWSLPLGTTSIGQGVFKQIVHATPAMLKMALAGIILSTGVAVLVGLISGYKAGTIDTALMTVTDIVIVLPALPLIIIITAIYVPEDPFLVGAILAIDQWPVLARQLRSQIITLRQESYVESARAMGISTPTIIGRDLLPQMAPYILVSSAQAATGIIKASVALYFIGVLPFTQSNWGVMMNYAYQEGNAVSNPGLSGHWLFFPALALAGLTFVLVLLSQGLDRVFNPRLRARHADSTPDEER